MPTGRRVGRRSQGRALSSNCFMFGTEPLFALPKHLRVRASIAMAGEHVEIFVGIRMDERTGAAAILGQQGSKLR